MNRREYHVLKKFDAMSSLTPPYPPKPAFSSKAHFHALLFSFSSSKRRPGSKRATKAQKKRAKWQGAFFSTDFQQPKCRNSEAVINLDQYKYKWVIN